MRKIVISDIHGYYEELQALLEKVEYKHGEDLLYFLGDYVDGGKQSKEVIQLVMSLCQHENVKAIGGNHDDMFRNYVNGIDYPPNPYTNERNGGVATITSFYPSYQKGVNEEEAKAHILNEYSHILDWLKNLPYYIEDDHHIYVHAGIDPSKENWKDTSLNDLRWIRGAFHFVDHTQEKTIVFGHTKTYDLHGDKQDFSFWERERKIGIDGGIKSHGCLNALIIENGQYTRVFVEKPSH